MIIILININYIKLYYFYSYYNIITIFKYSFQFFEH